MHESQRFRSAGAEAEVEVRALGRGGEEEVALFRAIRLRALEESPGAFGSTLERELPQEAEWWRQRLAKWTTPGTGAAFVALNGSGEACGLAAVFTRAEAPGRAELVSMWVSPAVRRSGVGGRLVAAVERWCRENGVEHLHLQVAEGNDSAVRFYERLQFHLTGHHQPMPGRDGVWELEMTKSLVC